MIFRISLLAVLASTTAVVFAFQCSPDTILRMGSDKRAKQIERECHEQKTGQDVCATKDELEKAWKEFQDSSEKYKKAVEDCRKYVNDKSSKKSKRTVLDGDMTDGMGDDIGTGVEESTNDHSRRIRRHHDHDGGHDHKHGDDGRHQHNVDHKKRGRRSHDDDPNDTTIDHTGHNHRRRRHENDDPNDTTIDHTGHNHKRRSTSNDDPNDTTIDHTGHNHKRRRSTVNDDPNDTTIDHTGHNHRRRRHENDDPNDTTIDHTGHNHKRRRSTVNDDPNDTTIDHTGHNHKRRRSTTNDDPNDTTIDHTGHNHRRRRHENDDPNDTTIDHTGHNHRRRRHHDGAQLHGNRSRRQTCSLAGSQQLEKMTANFAKHCERDNICLAMEDLPEGKQRDDFNEIHKIRAKKYSDYLTELFKCYGKL